MRKMGKIRNLVLYDDYSTIIYALIICQLDYCNYISTNKTDQCVHLEKIAAQRQYYRVSKLH